MNGVRHISRPVRKLGDSLGIILGKHLVEDMKLYEGAVIEGDIQKVEKTDETERYVIHCDTPIIFKGDEDIIYCPLCGAELHTAELEIFELDGEGR